ncbi:MAG: hypothetical protein D6680_02140 [Cyanobacteria bacterium J007]|nr:MAG: hypothetical protein D6680_02140 [Cyanobacteria bacterium J007]
MPSSPEKAGVLQQFFKSFVDYRRWYSVFVTLLVWLSCREFLERTFLEWAILGGAYRGELGEAEFEVLGDSTEL